MDHTNETAAENKEVLQEAEQAVEQPVARNNAATETGAENKQAVKAIVEAVEETAAKNAMATETGAENKAALKEAEKRQPQIPETPVESMDDYKDEIDKSMRKISIGDLVKGTVIAISDDEVTLDLEHYASGTVRKADYSADPKFNLKEDVHVGDEVTALVKKKDDGHGGLLCSVKEAAAEIAWDKLTEAMKEKTPLTVKISEVVKAGVLCYPEGVRAFIPASKLDLSFVDEKDLPSYVGKTVEAQVITCEAKDKKLVLSVKELLREKANKERASKISNVKVGLITEGKVENLTDFGAFVDIGEGLSGLVHISRISQNRIKHPSDVLKVGDTVKVKVIAIKDGKLSLSMKDVEGFDAEPVQEEKFEFKSEGEVGTSLADLIKQAGF